MKYRIIKLKRYWHFLWGISELRNGKRKVKNLTLETAEKLLQLSSRIRTK